MNKEEFIARYGEVAYTKMNVLTKAELERVIFLYKCGVDSEEIRAVINEDRKEVKTKRDNHIDYYIWCVLDEATF